MLFVSCVTNYLKVVCAYPSFIFSAFAQIRGNFRGKRICGKIKLSPTNIPDDYFRWNYNNIFLRDIFCINKQLFLSLFARLFIGQGNKMYNNIKSPF